MGTDDLYSFGLDSWDDTGYNSDYSKDLIYYDNPSSKPTPHEYELDQIYCGTPVLKTYLGCVMPDFKVALNQIAMSIHSLMDHDHPCVPDGKRHQPPEPTMKHTCVLTASCK